MTDQELYDTLFNGICTYKERHYEDHAKGVKPEHPYEFPFEAYVDLAQDLGKFKAGTTMRVYLASNMGDLCLTRDLVGRGYELRVLPGLGCLTNCRIVKMGELDDAVPTEGHLREGGS